MPGKLSIVIPSRNEIFLQKTILDILKNSTEEIEIFPVLDGYEPPENEIVIDPRVKYIRLPQVKHTQKRHGINKAIAESDGEFVMSIDAHCMVAPGFDAELKKGLQENWVVVPRRHRLDAENWCLQTQVDTRPPIDYEYLMYPKNFEPRAFHGFKWDARTLERWNTPIDDIITMQGSIWLMHRSHFEKMGLMQIEGYTGWGQEAEEISFKTWFNGGRVIVNKNTWYAHLHKGDKYGRMYFLSKEENRNCYRYAYNYWAIERKEFFVDLVKRFSPMPGWHKNWEEDLYA